MVTPEDVASNPTIATIIQGRLSGNVSTELMLIWNTLYTPNKHALYLDVPVPVVTKLKRIRSPSPKAAVWLNLAFMGPGTQAGVRRELCVLRGGMCD
jgi:hypothetical protein